MSCRSVIFRKGLQGLCLWVCLQMPAFAHPHIFIDGNVQLIFNSQGQIVALRQSWKFDELFAAYALQGVPRAKSGEVAKEELDKITKEWMTALADPESHFFTEAMQGTNKFNFGAAKDAATTWDAKSGQLTLAFELPFATPGLPANKPSKSIFMTLAILLRLPIRVLPPIGWRVRQRVVGLIIYPPVRLTRKPKGFYGPFLQIKSNFPRS